MSQGKVKRNNRKCITFTTSRGRGWFELSSDTDKSVFQETKRLSKLLADGERLGVAVSSRDLQCVNNLPSVIRDKFINYGLIEGCKNEKIPTLDAFLKEYISSRPDKSQAHHKRLYNYLTEYFGKSKRIDLIVPAKAMNGKA